MTLKSTISLLIFILILTNYVIEGLNSTNITETTTSTSSIEYRVKPSENTSRHLLLLFLGCLLTTILIIAMIVTYNRVVGQQGRSTTTNSNIRTRFQNLIQSINFNSLTNRRPFNFFSISNNNHTNNHHRQGETSRTHLNENQDEALLFDDPYADGGIAGGLHGSSANPYKSLTLAVT